MYSVLSPYTQAVESAPIGGSGQGSPTNQPMDDGMINFNRLNLQKD